MSASAPQLRWRCRRGMKELDVLLTRYLDKRYAAASADQQLAFETLLDQEDPVLWGWLIGSQPGPEGAIGELIRRLRHYR